MDISHTLEPNSDQLDAIELIGGPRTFTIESVSKGNAEQPVQLHLAGFPRPWRPGKSMRRVLVAGWGPDASVFVGRRVKLFCDPEVRFGGKAVGGTRIAAMSHLTKPLSVPLLITRGQSAVFTVQPLADEPAAASKTPVTAETLTELTARLRRKGVPESDWVRGANHVTKSVVTALGDLSEDQARMVLGQLAKRPDVEPPVDGDPCPVCGTTTDDHDTEAHEAAGV